MRKHERRLFGLFPVAPRRRVLAFLKGAFARRIVVKVKGPFEVRRRRVSPPEAL